ncbi:hypothetical protein [Calycomorphotria hydatis]|uniref:HEAT repeat domain-containing protein n=1 Tax=Calycomorphotria hydatis TaxID=2528027 RepID=A0A517TDL0_9PLAN|nr:hypothetical protein [Calycomorphotria hydatis]QDT66458.1 hypothetical protein V22_37250 [Calycomorphotria hydatis]
MESGSLAYHWLHENVEYSTEAPDEAFDWVFLMTGPDWKLIVDSWHQKDDSTREFFAYIVCNGPVLQSREMLLLALNDANANVAQQAAETLQAQREDFSDQFRVLTDRDQRLVEELIEKYEQ